MIKSFPRPGGVTGRTVAVAATVAAVALVAGCDSDITHGAITSKRYIAARQYTRLQPIYGTNCTHTSRGSSCRATVISWIPETVTDPECYQLSLSQDGQHGSVCVAPAEYDRAQVGGQW